MPDLAHRPRVTVLMPVHNGMAHLREAIESVLAQTFTDFEFLIIDDASTDGSVACIESYQDPRIRLVHNAENLGTSRTMNKGLALARAPYVARIDQDDVCLSERIEAQFAYLEQRPNITIVCSWEYTIDAQGRKIRNWRRDLRGYGEFLGYLAVGKSPIWHPSIMFRRQELIEAGGYDPAYSPAEDFEVSMRLALKGYRAAVVLQYLVMQRQHDQRQSVRREAAQQAVMARVHTEMVQIYCRHPEAENLARLLRTDDTFWGHARSKAQHVAVLAALDCLFAGLRAGLSLSDEEYESMTRLVLRRLGPGVRVARHLRSWPAPLFLAAFYGLSPLLIPHMRRALSVGFTKVYQLRYPTAMIQGKWQRLLGRWRSP